MRISKHHRDERTKPPLADAVDGASDSEADSIASGMPVAQTPQTEMLTYAQAAQFMNVPVGTLYDWVHRKTVPHVRLGPRLVRFPLGALKAWLRTRSVAGVEVAP